MTQSIKKVKGIVKWFNDSKGYGFIQTLENDNVFIHYTAIQGEGFQTLAEEQMVEFELVEGPRGLQAINLLKVKE